MSGLPPEVRIFVRAFCIELSSSQVFARFPAPEARMYLDRGAKAFGQFPKGCRQPR